MVKTLYIPVYDGAKKIFGQEPPGGGTTIVYGDVNGDNIVGILDALLISQYYVGLNPAVFIYENADVDLDGTVNIIDALVVARYYVGLINNLPYI